MTPLRIIHLAACVGKSSFGIGLVALNLARGQQALGHRAEIWSCDSATEARELEEENHLLPNSIRTFPIVGPHRLAYSPAMERAIAQRADEFDVVHQHGIWTATSRVTNRWRAQTGKPTVIAPHGSLQKWALGRSRWKKRLALMFYQQDNLQQAACLHATAETEMTDFRDFGLTNPIALISNGISRNWLNTQGDGDRFRATWSIPSDRRLLFFLSRITPKKGLPMLLEAIDGIRDLFEGWLLIIAGADEFGHKKQVEERVKELDLDKLVRFLGPLYGQAKRDAFAAADVFVLPSYSEGSPMIILDCLATGVPVITTKGSPWRDLVDYDCGWWTDISAAGLRDALSQAIGLSKTQLAAMGQRGRELVASRYTWEIAAEKTLWLYGWLLGREEHPDFVIR